MLQNYPSFTRLQLVAALNDIFLNMLADEVYVEGFHVPRNSISVNIIVLNIYVWKNRPNHTHNENEWKISNIHVKYC